MSSKKIKSTGISLIELMVSLLIISIISGVSLVSYQKVWQKNLLKNATEDLVIQLKMLKIKAILQNKTISYQIKSGYLRKWSGSEKKENISIYRLSAGVQYNQNRVLNFSSGGFAGAGTIILNFGDYQSKVIISLNGRIRKDEIK